MSDRRVSIVMVDDHLLFREGIREILDAQPDLEVVGETGDSASAVELIARVQPDVVLLDVEIPGGHVLATVQQINKLSPRSRLIILSMFDGPHLISDLAALDVHGYLLKTVSRHELVAVVRSAPLATGRFVLFVSRDSVRQFVVENQHSDGSVRFDDLSDREREVLRLTADALSNAQIAARLELSEATVKRLLRNVFTKLSAVSRIDAVNRGVAAGVIAAPGGQPAVSSGSSNSQI